MKPINQIVKNGKDFTIYKKKLDIEIFNIEIIFNKKSILTLSKLFFL